MTAVATSTSVPGPALAPTGWSPATPRAVPSVRGSGFVRGTWDALRGVEETGAGQPLSGTQVAVLAPLLARTWDLHVPEVARTLRDVRVYTGGPVAGKSDYAVTLGRDIYVDGQREVNELLGWDHRHWLTHELGHTLQWGRNQGTDLSRTRHFLGAYASACVVDNHRGLGAIPGGVATWVHENLDPFNHHKTHVPLADAVHDAHWMEREAEDAADHIFPR